MKLRKITLGFFLSVGFAAISFFVMSIAFDLDNVVSLLLSFSSFIIGLLFSVATYLNDWSEDEERLFHRLENRVLQSAEFLGSPEEAYEYLIRMLPGVRSIDNTHIKPLSVTNELLTSVSSETSEKFRKGIGDLINYRNGTVRDVVSDPCVSFFKAYRLNAMKGSRVPQNRYQLKAVATDINFINYMIMEFTSGKKEVLFGWAYDDDHTPNAGVFRATDQKLVSFFEKHFLVLLSHARGVDLPPPHQT